jgi:hypothetical protein
MLNQAFYMTDTFALLVALAHSVPLSDILIMVIFPLVLAVSTQSFFLVRL